MNNLKRKIGTKDLTVGKQYLHRNGSFVRKIEKIEGDTVSLRDQTGYGKCRRYSFVHKMPFSIIHMDRGQESGKLTILILGKISTSLVQKSAKLWRRLHEH